MKQGLALPPNPRRVLCTCSGCGAQWRDFPGPVLARYSPTGCPGCGGLYWTETEVPK